MDKLHKACINENGQSLVEYVLMLFVIVAIVSTLTQSKVFKSMFGEDSEFFNAMRGYIEYTYQHGSFEKKGRTYNYTDNSLEHGTYVNENPKKGSKSTHFFIPLDKYPQ